MENSKPRLLPVFFCLGLALAAIAATIVLPSLFVAPGARPETWQASISIACVLEALVALYVALPFFPGIRKRESMAVYPSISFVILPYLVAVVATMVFARNSVALYATLLSCETFLALGLVGILFIVGGTRRKVELQDAAEKATVYRPALEVRAIRDTLSAAAGRGADAPYKACADALRRLEERAGSATRFGRPGSESDESSIEDSIADLAMKVSGLAALEGELADKALAECSAAASAIVKVLDRRERSLVK